MYFRFHLFKKDLPLRNRALDAYAMRQRTTSKNIANINSPHYRPEVVKFEEFFHKTGAVLKGEKSAGTHIPLGKPSREDIEAEIHPRDIPKPDIYFSGETHVNIDKEMSEMAQNQIRFKFGSTVTNNFFTGLTKSITGNTFQNA